ncbi:MAG TPA: hypothetical protein V6D18_05595 [Thermosynechococcaceae cyanobacterium]
MPQLLRLLLITAIVFLFWGTPVQAQTTGLEEKFKVGASGITSLDFGQINLSDLGKVVAGGSIPKKFDEGAKYPVSRSWKAGDPLDRVLRLGDVPELAPQQFSIEQIAQLVDQPVNTLRLSNFKLLQQQSLSDLVQAIPYLGNFAIKDVKPLAVLLRGAAQETETIASLLRSQPKLGERSLGSLGTALENYPLTDLPNATATPLRAFHNWQVQSFEDVPGLSRVPLARMPRPLPGQSTIVARIASMVGTTDRPLTNTVTGTIQKGFRVACPDIYDVQAALKVQCGGVELADSVELKGQKSADKESTKGKFWILGQIQSVAGGTGALQNLPSEIGVKPGYEPTGRHPFGGAFKQVLEEVNESGVVKSFLVFRVCSGNSCSPYNQFKVPFIRYRLNDLIVLGADTIDSNTIDSNTSEGPQSSSYQTINSGPCVGDVVAGISVNTLAQAIAEIRDHSSSSPTDIGLYACTENNQCGRGLGQSQAPSYSQPVQAEISAKPGGADWLKQVASGTLPSRDDLLRFYPPETQTQVLVAATRSLLESAQNQIDPTTRAAWTGNRLIGRVAEMWAGGTQAAIDSAASVRLSGLSLAQYGFQAQKNYQARGGNPNLQCAAGEFDRTAPGQRVEQAARRLNIFSTAEGPDNGNQAAAWAVQRVLTEAGIKPLGDSPDYIPAVEAALQSRRGAAIESAQAQAGDIAISPDQSQIGICLTPGCTTVRSNSASRKTFGWDTSIDFDGEYNGASKIYRITQP